MLFNIKDRQVKFQTNYHNTKITKTVLALSFRNCVAMHENNNRFWSVLEMHVLINIVLKFIELILNNEFNYWNQSSLQVIYVQIKF